MDAIRWLLITSGGLGMSPVAPGTIGTFGGVGLALLFQWLVPAYSLAAWSVAAAAPRPQEPALTAEGVWTRPGAAARPAGSR